MTFSSKNLSIINIKTVINIDLKILKFSVNIIVLIYFYLNICFKKGKIQCSKHSNWCYKNCFSYIQCHVQSSIYQFSVQQTCNSSSSRKPPVTGFEFYRISNFIASLVLIFLSIKILTFETASDYQNRNQIHHLNWDVNYIRTDHKNPVFANDIKYISLYGDELFAKAESKLILRVLAIESASLKWRLRHQNS